MHRTAGRTKPTTPSHTHNPWQTDNEERSGKNTSQQQITALV